MNAAHRLEEAVRETAGEVLEHRVVGSKLVRPHGLLDELGRRAPVDLGALPASQDEEEHGIGRAQELYEARREMVSIGRT